MLEISHFHWFGMPLSVVMSGQCDLPLSVVMSGQCDLPLSVVMSGQCDLPLSVVILVNVICLM
jgi:hypothetical protein